MKEKESTGKRTKCLNCEHQLNNKEKFCPECGQKNVSRVISLKDLIIDFFGDYFAFDSKLFNTLRPLITQPGQVALDFVEGHRVHHIPPLRILIFTSFIFFFVFGVLPKGENKTIKEEGKLEIFDGTNMTFYTEDYIDSLSLEAKNQNLSLKQYLENDSAYNDFDIKMVELPLLLREGFSPEAAADSLCKEYNFFQRRFVAQLGKVYNSDTNTTSNYFIGNISFALLMFQPIIALILKLFYGRRRKFFISHLVFSLYLHAFLALFLTFNVLLDSVLHQELVLLALDIGALVYVYFSLKRFYGQKRGMTILKTILITILYLALLTPLTILMSMAFSFFFF